MSKTKENNNILNSNIEKLLIDNNITLVESKQNSSFIHFPNEKEKLDQQIINLIKLQNYENKFYLLCHNTHRNNHYKFIISNKKNTISISLADLSITVFNENFLLLACIREGFLLNENISISNDNKILFNLPLLNDNKIKLKEFKNNSSFSFKSSGIFGVQTLNFDENNIHIELINGAIKNIYLDKNFELKKITLSKKFINKFELKNDTFFTNDIESFLKTINSELDIFKLINDEEVYFMSKDKYLNIIQYFKKILNDTEKYNTKQISDSIKEIIKIREKYVLNYSEMLYSNKLLALENIIIKSISKDSIINNFDLIEKLNFIILKSKKINTVNSSKPNSIN